MFQADSSGLYLKETDLLPFIVHILWNEPTHAACLVFKISVAEPSVNFEWVAMIHFVEKATYMT